MKKIIRIIISLLLACLLLPVSPAYAGGIYVSGCTREDIQRMLSSGGQIDWCNAAIWGTSTPFSVTTSVEIFKRRDIGGFHNYGPNSIFSVDSDDVTFYVDPAMTIKASDTLPINITSNGGIICVNKNNCTIDGFNISYGRTRGYYGGAIYVYGDNCTIKNCHFTQCSSGYCGGAIYVYGDECTIDNCTFKECSSQYGGAVYLQGYSTEIKFCTFTDCSATVDGGAIYANDDADITGCHFVNNKADNGYGGSICDDNGPGQVVISGCDFSGGNSKENGGIWVYGWGDAKVEKCTRANSSYYYYLKEIDSITLAGSVFSDGNIWIIAGIGAVAVGALAVIIAKKKKKVTE